MLVNHNRKPAKFVINKAFLKLNHKKFREFFASSGKKKPFTCACDGAYCPFTWAFTICRSSVIYFVRPPNVCITIVFNFSRVSQLSQEKLKIKFTQYFGGQTRCIVGAVQMANDAYCPILHCPIIAEIRTVDSQSDLRILL